MTSPSVTLSNPSESMKPAKRALTVHQRQRRWGFVFLSPWILGFMAFTLFPMAASAFFSFTDFKIGQPITFIGLDNWKKLFSDPITLQSLGVTLRFGMFMLPLSILFPLFMATLLNSKWLQAKPFFRLFFYMPYIIPAVSGVLIWTSFLGGQTGMLNRLLHLIAGLPLGPEFLTFLGINAKELPAWLTNSNYLNTGLVLIGLWGVGNAMLTMMASMQGVPTELYEAAKVDGATGLTMWRRITLPMISPVIFYNLVLTVIGLMQYFIVPYILSGNARSDPNMNFINLHLYRTAFTYFDMGYASALAWFLFIVALSFTVFLFATARRWVYYASGDN